MIATERSMLCALSGPAAERAFYGIDLLGIDDDWAAKRMAKELAGDDFDALCHQKRNEADALIRDYSDAVRVVGEELLKQGRLNGPEVRALVVIAAARRDAPDPSANPRAPFGSPPRRLRRPAPPRLYHLA
jgi:hypothetical protein